MEYVELMARVYDRYWGPYPRRIAGQLLTLHDTLAPDAERRVLDVGCGTGLVAERFVAAGYAVTGLDRAAGMLALARERLRDAGERVHLFEGDATGFAVDTAYPYVVSTYDIANHLGPAPKVAAYLRAVHTALEPGGLFAFDLATRRGVRGMHAIQVRDDEDALLVFRGAFHEEDQVGYYRITGMVRAEDGRYDRFATTIGNHAFAVADVLDLVADAGLVVERIGTPDDVLAAVDEPEDQPRVVITARRPT